MVRKVLFGFLAILLVLGFTVPCNSDARIHRSMHQIHMYSPSSDTGRTCTAYSIGPHALLTAEHCLLTEPDTKLYVDDDPYEIFTTQLDQHDHAILLIKGPAFKSFVSAWQSRTSQRDQVHYYGHPAAYDMYDQYREGYVSGYDAMGDKYLTIMVIPGIQGDSGSAIFDSRGRIVGILSLAKTPFVASFDIAFTAKQFQDARHF